MQQLKKLGAFSIAIGFILLTVLNIINDEVLDEWLVYDDDAWPFIWRLGGRLVVIGVGILALAFYKVSANSTEGKDLNN